ncbi:MAG TPA: SH3 domain-containing protein, partial [Myxococcales bacterium]|nr:SH3 domain-containing protein [Myxococcales bacterium]
MTPEEIGHAESELLYGILAGSTVRATDNVYLRTGPAITYPSIRLVSSGERATVVQESSSGGFYKLDVGGTIGWSHGDYWELVPRLYVNGYLLTPNQEKWLRWVAAKTVPRLTGTRAERVNKVAWVAWWA